MINVNNLKEAIKNIVKETVQFQNGLDIYRVINVYDDFTVDIKNLNGPRAYTKVSICSAGLGNGRGFIWTPSINDLVLVGFLQDSEKPFVLGSLLNRYMSFPDSVIPLKPGEVLLNNKINGSYLFINENQDIILKTENSTLKLLNNGKVYMLNKTKHGIYIDEAGNMTISGNTINHTQTPLT